MKSVSRPNGARMQAGKTPARLGEDALGMAERQKTFLAVIGADPAAPTPPNGRSSWA